jgi:hypothetical protein
MISLECEKLEANAVGGQPIDLEQYGTLTDRLGRCFQRLGLKRQARDVTASLSEYLKSIEEEAVTEAEQRVDSAGQCPDAPDTEERTTAPTTPDQEERFLDALAGLMLPAGEPLEDRALLSGEPLAHGGDQHHAPIGPRRPAQGITEQPGVAKGLPHGDRAAFHASPSPVLLDHPRLIVQLCGLERSVTRSGKEQINPAPGAMDDVANAVAGALLLALVATPSLWAAEAFLVAGAPARLPRECLMLFAVVVSDKHGQCGIAYFLPQLGGPLIVLDWELKDYLTPTVLTDVPARLGELSATLRARTWCIFTTKGLEQEFRSLGVGGVEAADAVIGDDDGLLRLAAAKHINANKVKSAKPDNLTGLFGSLGENPLKTALLTGIVLALDAPGRSLTKPRAA